MQKRLEVCPSCRLRDLFCPACGRKKLLEPDGSWFDSWWACSYACIQRLESKAVTLPADVYCTMHQEALDRLKVQGLL